MMPLRKIIILALMALSTACLAFGFARVAQWAAAAAVLAFWLVWLAAWRWPNVWSPSAALLVSIGIASGGLLAGAASLPVLIGITLILAVWDLTLLDQVIASTAPGKALAYLEQKHYQSLGLAVGIGLLGVVAGQIVRFPIPFVGVVFLAILAFFGLDRIWRLLWE